MSMIWLWWREPAHDLGILIGFIDGGVSVKTICYVATVGIAVAEFHRVHAGSVGYDALSKMLVECRNDKAICAGIGAVRAGNISEGRAEESGAMWLVLPQCLISIQPLPPQNP